MTDREGEHAALYPADQTFRLDEHWARFLHQNRFLLGISLDGPSQFHDAYRLDRARFLIPS